MNKSQSKALREVISSNTSRSNVQITLGSWSHIAIFFFFFCLLACFFTQRLLFKMLRFSDHQVYCFDNHTFWVNNHSYKVGLRFAILQIKRTLHKNQVSLLVLFKMNVIAYCEFVCRFHFSLNRSAVKEYQKLIMR